MIVRIDELMWAISEAVSSTAASISTDASATSSRTSTCVSGRGWHRGTSSAVRFAAITPAICAVVSTATCVAGVGDCDEPGGAPYFQASLCQDHLDSLNYNDYFKLDTTTASLDRTKKNCTTTADRRRYLVHIYVIANNDEGSDGVPTLKRAELTGDGTAPVFTIVSEV